MKEFRYTAICHDELDFETTMIGQTFCQVERGCILDEGELRDCFRFTTKNDTIFLMYHRQKTFESVVIENVCGDLNDLAFSPIVKAVCVNNKNRRGHLDVMEWTFFHLLTTKGTVSIRWFGTSDGFHPTTAKLYKVDSDEQLRRTVVI